MYMIGHDAPGKEPVAPFVEMEEGFAHHFGYPLISQFSGASATIEILFDANTRELRHSSLLVVGEFAIELVGSVENILLLELDLAEECAG